MEWDQLEPAQLATLQAVAQRLAAAGRSDGAPGAVSVLCLQGVDRLQAAGLPVVVTGFGAADPVVEIQAVLRELGELPPTLFDTALVLDVAAGAQAALLACRAA